MAPGSRRQCFWRRPRRPLRAQLAAALSSLNAVQGHVLGVVLNRVPARSAQDGYYQQYTAAG